MIGPLRIVEPRTCPDPRSADTPLRFPGQYRDAETGLHYNVFRYYDPATARYVSQDPLGLAPAPNPVTYVSNPLVATDPLGLTSSCSNSGGSSTPPATPNSNTKPSLVQNSGATKMSNNKFNKDHVIDDPKFDQSVNDYVNSPANPGAKRHASEAMAKVHCSTCVRAPGWTISNCTA